MGERGIAHGGRKIGRAERIDRHGEKDIAHHHGHIFPDPGRIADLAQPFLDQLVESGQAAAALGLIDDIVMDQDEGVEQFQGQRGPQERAVLKGPISPENAVGTEQQQGADALAATGHELGDVEVKRLEEVPVGVALRVLLEETSEKGLE